MKKERVEILDSFRFLAIMAVMLMHFTYRWNPPAVPESLYPYGTFFGLTFYYGYLGVQFFFIISGFVISYTLENTAGMSSFLKNRFIRLFPPMLLCTLITYFVCIKMDKTGAFDNAHSLYNFLPSLTFTKPTLWSAVLHRHFSFISLSYWTLWVEVQFYVIAGLLFYANQRTFLRNLVLLTILLNIFNYIPDHFIDPETYHHLPGWLNMVLTRWYYNRLHFDIKFYISWFSIGVVFHRLFKEKKIPLKSLTGIGVLFIFFNQLYLCDNIQVRVIYLIMISLFFCMIYRRHFLSFLDNPVFRRIGVISYSIYLIHEILGVLIINKYGGYLGKASFLSPFIVIILVIIFAELSYRFYEKKASFFLKRLLSKSKSKEKQLAVSKVAAD
jgi:peptidoglycan/LPS O-acetylase OafA/YrhL